MAPQSLEPAQVVQSEGGSFKEEVSYCEEAETAPLRSQDVGLGDEDLLQGFSGVASFHLQCLRGLWEPGSCW